MVWTSGQSGNPNGARKPRIIAQQLISSLNEAAAGTDRTKLRLLVDRLIERAIVDGDVAAIREIVDRVDGKIPQAIEGSLEVPLTIELIRRVIVDGSRVLIDAAADDLTLIAEASTSPEALGRQEGALPVSQHPPNIAAAGGTSQAES